MISTQMRGADLGESSVRIGRHNHQGQIGGAQRLLDVGRDPMDLRRSFSTCSNQVDGPALFDRLEGGREFAEFV